MMMEQQRLEMRFLLHAHHQVVHCDHRRRARAPFQGILGPFEYSVVADTTIKFGGARQPRSLGIR